MEMRDTTVEANSGEQMADYYLYHVQSKADDWALAVEQAQVDVFHVSALYKQPGWDLFGVVRYWTFDERAMAEASYLELQRIFGEIPPGEPLKLVLARLPKSERTRINEADE